MPLVLLLIIAAAPMKLASPGLSCANLEPKLAASYLNHFNQQLSLRGGFQVTSSDEIGQVLGLERQKQLLGCSDGATECNAEIASALGVDAIIVGSMNKTGHGYLVNIKVLRAKDASALAVYSGRPDSDEALLDLLERWAQDFSAQYGAPPAAAASPVAEVATGTSSAGPARAWIYVGGGAVAALVAGGVMFGMSKGVASSVREPTSVSSPEEYQALIRHGQTLETAGLITLGVGAALAATSAVLFATTRPTGPTVSVLAGPGTFGLVLSGSLP